MNHLLRIFRLVWDNISAKIDTYFNEKELDDYFKVAQRMKKRIINYLDEQEIDYKIQIIDDSEPDWMKVTIKILVVLPTYQDCLDLWEKICAVGYTSEQNEFYRGVFTSVDLMNK